MTVKSPMKWHGGKYYLAEQIIRMMPPHVHYVEPYFGAGHVLFRKEHNGVSEVVNDIDGDLMAFWDVVSCQPMFDNMLRRLRLVPFSEHVFEAACVDRPRGKVARAVDFFIKYRQSRQGLGKDFATLSRNRTRGGMNEQVSAWLGAIELLPAASERLRRVVVLNRSAIDVINQQDGENTLFYLDPPYLHSTRKSKKAYKFEMDESQHAELLATLLTVKGKFILSGYRSDMYDSAAAVGNLWRTDIAIDNKSSGAKVKEIKTECLWTNFKPENTQCQNTSPTHCV